jgi:hypothetical protein
MKTTRARLTLVSLFPAAIVALAACAADTGAPAAETGAEARHPALAAGRAHLLPMPGAARGDSPAGHASGNASSTAHMVYRGGPVISNVKVFTVYWNAGVPNQSALDGFYGTIVNSPYVDWLSEYDTPTQKIGRGSFIGSYVDPSAPTTTQLTDDAIRQELGKLIDQGSLPAPDADTLFMMHFPAGVSITMDGAASCQQFCAYHSSFVHGAATVYYGIMPDFSGGCASCGGESTQLDGTTVVASHEVAEAMTDPDIGVANDTQNEKMLAWYDDTNDEIGDVCEGQSATVAGYRVTQLWSNQRSSCYAPSPSAGTGGSGTGGSTTSGTGGSTTSGTGGSTTSTGGGGTGGAGTGHGGGGPSCAHPICKPGVALSPSCGPCTARVCEMEPRCCTDSWEPICVEMAVQVCGKHCR